MALRLVEMVCPEERGSEVEELVAEHEPLGLWHDRLMDGQIMVQILLPAEKAEAVLDLLESHYAGMEGFRMLLLSVEAAVPRPKPPDEAEETTAEEKPRPTPMRISRQELYAGISASARLTRVFLAMIILSSLVAAIGIWRDSLAVIIGAMVIAPLLGPNMALSLATTLGDGELGRRALKTSLVGIVVALAISFLIGAALRIDPQIGEVASRAQVSLADVVLALAAGTAGALAFTTGIHTPLVGVMVAVALLPPLVAVGLLLGAAEWAMAGRAALLFFTNLICVNLAGVGTFLANGIRPRTWWEADKARRA
ncbi:MAG: TIGR00341 family protein, partial [Planctomycetota bacterium]